MEDNSPARFASHLIKHPASILVGIFYRSSGGPENVFPHSIFFKVTRLYGMTTRFASQRIFREDKLKIKLFRAISEQKPRLC